MSAEWQVKPFLGATYAGNTTFVTYSALPGVEQSNHGHTAFGVSGLWLSEIFGVEGDYGHTSGFFEGTDAPFVTDSGNVLFDCVFSRIDNPEALDQALKRVPGVVENGLFLGIADVAIIAGPEGVAVIERGEDTSKER